MRRKRPPMTAQMVAEGVLLAAAPSLPVNDVTAPYEARRAAFDVFHEAFEQWQHKREQWAAEHGWPEGETARLDEEDALIAQCPDSPFDPAWEIANGHL